MAPRFWGYTSNIPQRQFLSSNQAQSTPVFVRAGPASYKIYTQPPIVQCDMVHTAEVIFAWTLWALERLSVNSTPLTNSRFINDGVGGRIPLALQPLQLRASRLKSGVLDTAPTGSRALSCLLNSRPAAYNPRTGEIAYDRPERSNTSETNSECSARSPTIRPR
jgi:hypothetical protein